MNIWTERRIKSAVEERNRKEKDEVCQIYDQIESNKLSEIEIRLKDWYKSMRTDFLNQNNMDDDSNPM